MTPKERAAETFTTWANTKGVDIERCIERAIIAAVEEARKQENEACAKEADEFLEEYWWGDKLGEYIRARRLNPDD